MGKCEKSWKQWKSWNGGKRGKSGKFAATFHNLLILNHLIVLLSYRIGYRLCTIVIYYILSSKFILLMLSRVLMPFGHRTPRKRDSCFNIASSPSGFVLDCTAFVKVHSTTVGELGGLRDLRGLGVGGHGMGKLSKSVFNPNRVWAKI